MSTIVLLKALDLSWFTLLTIANVTCSLGLKL